MDIERAVRECLIALDISGMRKLWPYMHPHIPQPEADDQILHMMHLARMQMRTLDSRQKAYSRRWLDERAKLARDAWAVGISVRALGSHRQEQALMTRCALEYAVTQAIKDGVDLGTEADEIKRRLDLARSRA